MAELDVFLDAVELHRQRDVLESCVREFVATFDAMQNRPGDPMLSVELLYRWAGAKMLLADLDKAKQ